MASYEFWLLNDFGQRITLLDHVVFANYTRVVKNLGTLQIGLPYEDFILKVQPDFQPDRRVDVWRSPGEGYPMRREGQFLLREPRIYSRDDGMRMIEFFGRSPLDLLDRRAVAQAAGSTYTVKSAKIDDFMKAIVREQMLYGSVRNELSAPDNTRAFPQYEFTVQADQGLGPTVTRSFAGRMVLDVLKDLQDTSFQKNEESSANKRIYFDVVSNDLLSFLIYILDADSKIITDESGDGLLDESSSLTSSPLGFQFQTFANRRGIDRTNLLVFSEENENLQRPEYSKNHLEEVNSALVLGQGEGASRAALFVNDNARMNASRWNRREAVVESSNETTTSALQEAGRAELNHGKPKEELNATILNSPGGPNTPRSLYGLDWDLGDLVTVNFAGRQMQVEIQTIYVSLDENGSENILGRNTIE